MERMEGSSRQEAGAAPSEHGWGSGVGLAMGSTGASLLGFIPSSNEKGAKAPAVPCA